jgi:hypothetical protein
VLLGEAVGLVARLGGYLGRTKDPPPGHQVLWHGHARLQAMCEGYSLKDVGAT